MLPFGVRIGCIDVSYVCHARYVSLHLQHDLHQRTLYPVGLPLSKERGAFSGSQ